MTKISELGLCKNECCADKIRAAMKAGTAYGRATPTLSAAMELPEIKAIHAAAEYFAKKRKSIMTDIGSAHSSRGAVASSWMREDDNDFYHGLGKALDDLSAALAQLKEPKP